MRLKVEKNRLNARLHQFAWALGNKRAHLDTMMLRLVTVVQMSSIPFSLR